MASNNTTQRKQNINRKIDEAQDAIVQNQQAQQAIDDELNALLAERHNYMLLGEISDRLDQLNKEGGAQLFWGDDYDHASVSQITQRARNKIVSYDSRVAELKQQQDAGQEDIECLTARVHVLNEENMQLEEVAEEHKNDFVIEREMEPMPYRAMVMPWTRQGEDEKRFRRILLICLFLSVLLGYLVPLWEIPIPDRIEPVKIPERMAQLIVEKEPPPPPPPPKQAEKKPEETTKDKRPKEKAPKPKTKKAKVARKKAESAGLLAFKDNFADLIDTAPEKKLGAKARISNQGKTARKTSRSLVTAQATAGSGGISTASLSRNVGGAGKGIKGVGFERVESAIGSDFFGEERPLSDGVGPSRTDEEIQIVFDRYKSALYRIYNRELRSNPTLQGKMVLRLTIEPDGAVSSCNLDSSDMDSPTLEKRIVARVLKFNFGPKEGVPPITILYPIDFLPAT
ncbi:MAG: AgmX/PglI C-terminal domain-containing protein [Gammaproteobacteria bacterium]|nr:AgmX/PglI C-terminal domain-containing protein [Gammaproteobacteria bacterium]